MQKNKNDQKLSDYFIPADIDPEESFRNLLKEAARSGLKRAKTEETPRSENTDTGEDEHKPEEKNPEEGKPA